MIFKPLSSITLDYYTKCVCVSQESPRFLLDKERLEVHIDTDEGNAVDLANARKVHLEK